MRVYVLAVAVCSISCLSFVGCNGTASPQPGKSPATVHDAPSNTSDAHGHPTEGPHHGTLVELGNEEYHVEVTHDAASVTVYVLDSSAQKSVAVDASEVTINLLQDGAPAQFKLLASPQQDDPSGTSSRFILADAELASHMDDESAAPKLALTIGGTPYRGEIKHVHDHSDHAHSDHAHEH